MPELRKDPITGRWVIISTDRAKRPMDFVRESVTIKGTGICPFCPGNEGKTPPEILAYGRNGGGKDTPGWSLRVVPNKFPALGIEGGLDREGEGLFDRMNGVGAHEVIVETPDHQLTLATMPEKAVEEALWAYRDRMLDLKNDRRFRYILLFKNHGEPAGASLEHTHSQLIALPDRSQARARGSGQFEALLRRKRALYFLRHDPPGNRNRDARDPEQRSLHRAGTLTRRASRLKPGYCRGSTAPRLKICPRLTTEILRRSCANFLDASTRRSRFLRTTYVIHTSPIGEEINDHYHWHIEMMPKLTKVAGFEWGTGFYINPTPPEEAARFLRDANS